MTEVLEFEKNIGKGSQATIDIYKTRHQPAAGLGLHQEGEGTRFAVKSYILRGEGENADFDETEEAKVMRAVHAEIKFLRELQTCDNIITIECVYKQKDKYQLVLRYAEYGCLRNFIIG